MNEKFLELLNNDFNLYPSKLEQEYPHIFEKLINLWKSSELKLYLDGIIFDERGDRRGFSDDIGNELWKLHLYRLSCESAVKDANRKDYWDWIN